MSGSVGQENRGQAATSFDSGSPFTAQKGGSVVGSSAFSPFKSSSTPTPFPASAPAPPLSALPPWTGRTMFTSTMNPFPPCTFSPRSTATSTSSTKTAPVFTSYAGTGGSFLATPARSSESLSTFVKSPRSPPMFTTPSAHMPRTTFGAGSGLSHRYTSSDNTTDVHGHAPTFGQSGITPLKTNFTATGISAPAEPSALTCSTNQGTYNHLPTALAPTIHSNSTGNIPPSHTDRSPSIATATPYPNALTPIPDELMNSIYSYCSRSTLLNCMLVDRRQFSIVVAIVWRTVRSSEGNLNQLRGFGGGVRGSASDPQGHWGHARSRVYLAAIRNYVTTSRPHFSERFNFQEELPFLSDQCPDIRRVEIAYGNVIRLVLHRQAGTSEWMDLEMIVTDVTRFIQAEDDHALWFSEMIWPGQASEGRARLADLRLVRLSIEDSVEYHGRHVGESFEYFLDWIRPYTRHLETLEIGPDLCELAVERTVDFLIHLLQLRPSIEKLHLCGYMDSNLVARIINTSISNLEELAFCACLPDYDSAYSFDHDDEEENSEHQLISRAQPITEKHPALVRAIDAIDRLKRLVLYVNPEEVNYRLGHFKTKAYAPTDRLDIFAVPKSCPTSLAHIHDTIFEKDARKHYPIRARHYQWLKDMEEALRVKRESLR